MSEHTPGGAHTHTHTHTHAQVIHVITDREMK